MSIKINKILSEGIAIGLVKKIDSNNNSIVLDDIDNELEKFNNTIYVFLANLDNPRDQLIKKYYENATEELLPLESDFEFALAMNLYMN